MKKANKIVLIVAVIIFFATIALYLILGFVATFSIDPILNHNPSQEIIEEIENVFMFELAPHETISIRFFPGMLQARRSIRFIINEVQSTEDFLSRFHGGTVEAGWPNSVNISHLFENNNHHEFFADLSFCEEENTATFHVYNGGWPELNAVFGYMRSPPFWTNPIFIAFVAVHWILFAYLAIYYGIHQGMRLKQYFAMRKHS
ncbi:MAG: hypothetical protein FWB93_02065 [Oscillospiraceae bacterium]|nr:hypothetical protein [Oscillospiraceae bacterium]